MNRIALILSLLAPAWASAQSRRYSHEHIPSNNENIKPSELLYRRLLETQVPQIINHAQGLPADAQKLLASPFGAEIARKLREGDPTLLNMAVQIAQQRPELAGIDPQELRDRLQGAAQSLTIGPGGEQLGPARTGILNPPPVVERERLTNQAYTERLEDLLHTYRLDEVASELHDSPIVRDMLRDLSRVDNRSASGARITLGNIATAFDTLDGYIRDAAQFLPKSFPTMPRIDLHSASMPSIGVPGAGLHAPSPRFNFGGDGWTIAAVCLAATLVAIALWRLTGPGLRRPAAIPLAARLGPWPVDPANIRTREELIAAFEYLALLKCGLDAAHWNHHTVADRLGQVPALRSDAEQLARLYEQARYAPHPAAPWESARAVIERLCG